MKHPFDGIVHEELYEIIKSDDKERLLPLLSAYSHTIRSITVVDTCGLCHAKKCLLAIIQGEAGITAQQLYDRAAAYDSLARTPLISVANYFPEADDIIRLLLDQGPAHHANLKCTVYILTYGVRCICPLDHVLLKLSEKSHLLPWSSSDSLIKLIILLCQWESKSSLNCARLLAQKTDGINDIAWSYVKEGILAPLAALLLVAQEKVLVPFGSGLTIRQRIMDMLQKLSSQGVLDYKEAMYQSMLIQASKLLDIFERAGGALRLYCSSMHEYVPPHKVLADVASVLKRAGYTPEPIDLDLRDCYRDCADVRNASVPKLSDPESPNKKYCLPSSLNHTQGFGGIRYSFPNTGNCQLFHRLKSGPMLNLKIPSASEPRLLGTVASQVENGGSRISQKHLAYIAFRLKRGIKF